MVSVDSACFLKCVYCPWNSKEQAIAPTPANLIQLLREIERGGPAARQYHERMAQHSQACEDAALQRSQQESKARGRKTHALLHGRAFLGNLESSGRVLDGSAAPASAMDETGDVMTASVVHLEQAQIAKNREQFCGASQRIKEESNPNDESEAINDEQERGEGVIIERQILLTGTSKHCAACDKLLVKCDVNPHNALDAKNRIHVAAGFVVAARLVSMSGARGLASIRLSHPMKNSVTVRLGPSDDSPARWTLAEEREVILPAADARLPVVQMLDVAIKATGLESPYQFAIKVAIQYQGILGPQSVQYVVSYSRKK